MLKTTPTRCKGRTSAGLVSGARPRCAGWRSVFWSNSAPFETQRKGAGLHCLTISFFSFLLSSLKDVLRHGMETAVRFKMRRNKNTMLCCISCCSSHPALHLPTSILTAPGMQPVMAPAKMEEMALESIEKGHGKDAELHSLWPGQVDNSMAAVLLSQGAPLDFADSWQTGMWRDSGRPLCIFRLFQQQGVNSCSKEMFSHVPPVWVGEKLPLT